MTLTRTWRVPLRVTGVLLLLACGSCAYGSAEPVGDRGGAGPVGSGPSSPGPSSSVRDGSPASRGGSAPSGSVVSGIAYRFTVPDGMRLELVRDAVESSGAHVRRWRWSPDGSAPYCSIMAVEHPEYPAAQGFPQNSIVIFGARTDPAERVLRNEVVTPPHGARSAVAQEFSGSTVKVAGRDAVVHGYLREQLTPGNTLLQFGISTTEDMLTRCAAEQIADSFVPTGAEAPAAGPARPASSGPAAPAPSRSPA